jgi:hypothetical protein
MNFVKKGEGTTLDENEEASVQSSAGLRAGEKNKGKKDNALRKARG